MSSSLMWLPNWLGLSYAKLYNAFGDGLFTFEQAVTTIHSGSPKLVVSLLRRRGWLSVFRRIGKKRSYRLLRPEQAMVALALGASVIPEQRRYANLVASVMRALKNRYQDQLRSVAVFGSVGRGTARSDSDMDVLVVAEFHGDAASRIDELVEIEYSGEIGKELTWLKAHGVRCHISWFPLTPEEAVEFRPLYLDMVEDALIVYDSDGFLKAVLDELRKRLDLEEAKRIWLDKDRWYWKLNPNIARELVVKA